MHFLLAVAYLSLDKKCKWKIKQKKSSPDTEVSHPSHHSLLKLYTMKSRHCNTEDTPTAILHAYNFLADSGEKGMGYLLYYS